MSEKPLSIKQSDDGSFWIILQGQKCYAQRRFPIRATDNPMSDTETMLVSVCDRLEATEAEKQAGIDAALESVARDISVGVTIDGIEGHPDDFQIKVSSIFGKWAQKMASMVRSRIGQSPLADAQRRIAELLHGLEGAEAVNADLAGQITDLQRRLEVAEKDNLGTYFSDREIVLLCDLAGRRDISVRSLIRVAIRQYQNSVEPAPEFQVGCMGDD